MPASVAEQADAPGLGPGPSQGGGSSSLPARTDGSGTSSSRWVLSYPQHRTQLSELRIAPAALQGGDKPMLKWTQRLAIGIASLLTVAGPSFLTNTGTPPPPT